MSARFILAGVFGGLAMFMWGAISHMFLPWHDATYNTFRDEDLVTEVMMKEAGESGIYIAPMGDVLNPNLTGEAKHTARDEMWQKSLRGPNVFVSFRREGMSGMATPMILDLLTLIVMAFVMLFLLQAVPQLTWMGKVLFVVIVGTLGMALVQMEQWIWWSFSSGYVLVNIVDGAVRWAVGGMVLAKVGK
ncbi:MAG: hypothetical protein KDB65_07715 [Calditrichaeota bacterium]|nr:hypothetical protein [Calditrichota bacterium]MCB9369357.1 hypothetical protein [Calditrichota bacterium]